MATETRALALMSEGSAIRFPALLFSAALVGLIYLFGVRLGGRWVAIFAAIAFAALPRGFFHAHMAAFDVPVATMVALTLYGFWRSQWSRGWAWATAVIWGFALLTKHNAFFVPVFLVLYWLWAGRAHVGLERLAAKTGPRWPLWGAAAVLVGAATALLGAGGLVVGALAVPVLLGWRLRLPPLPLTFLLMPVVGLTLLFLLWPKLWYDPARAFRDYLAFHLHHEHYMQYYFGRILQVPPFPVAFPFVLTAVTVPVLTLLAFGGGAVVVWGRSVTLWFRRVVLRTRAEGGSGPDDEYGRRVRAFLAVNLLMPILLIALPKTPIFGGVKHWLTAMPFFAIVAGFGFDWARRKVLAVLAVRRQGLRTALGSALLLVLLLPACVETARIHPFGTAYYNGLLGGVQGAARARMHRQFWGYATRQTFDRLNEVAPRGAKVFFQNTTHDAFEIYRRDGLLRADLRYAWGPAGADYALLEHQKSFAELEMQIWEELETIGPAWQVTVEGVPMISVYERQGR